MRGDKAMDDMEKKKINYVNNFCIHIFLICKFNKLYVILFKFFWVNVKKNIKKCKKDIKIKIWAQI